MAEVPSKFEKLESEILLPISRTVCTVLPRRSTPETTFCRFVLAMRQNSFARRPGCGLPACLPGPEAAVACAVEVAWGRGSGAWTTTLETSACFAVENSNKPVVLTEVRVGEME